MLARAPNWAAAAAAAGIELGGHCTVHSKILEWRMVDPALAAVGMAVGCTGHLMVEVLKRGAWRIAEQEGQY